MKFKSLYNFCKSKNDSFLFVFIRHIYYKLRYNKELLISNGVRISHPQNINMNGGRIEIGFIYPEFVVKEDKTLLLCEGTFRTEGLCLINKGSRIAVTKDGVLTLRSCFINSNVKILCEHSISIGEGTAIGWGSQICDDNYHVVKYANKNISTPTKAFAGGVNIGKNVLVGNHCYIYRNVEIADGCVVASNSVVKNSFKTPKMLIAGNPAREIKEIESWN